MLAAALACVKRGWPVFPLHTPTESGCSCRHADCESVGKHPRTKNGLLGATTDEETIRRWWSMWPDANLAVACGPSGLTAIDVDPRHGGDESFRDLLKSYPEITDTVVALTGGGGAHYLYAAGEPAARNSEGTIAPGIDVRGDGGYIAVAPSLHVSGQRYRWERSPDEFPLAPFPVGIVPQSPTRTADPIGDAIPKGRRDATLASLAGSMRSRGMSEEEIRAALQVTNANRCQPPLSDADIERIARSVSRYEPAKEVLVGTARPAVVTYSAAALGGMNLPEPRHAVVDLLSEGLAICGGKPKTGKSWMFLNTGIAIATGGMVLGKIKVDAADVLFLALEDSPRRIRERLRIVLGGAAFPDRLYFATEWPRLDNGGTEALDGWLNEHPDARLVIVDTWAKVRPRRVANANTYDEDYAHFGALKRIADAHRVCILVIHHLRKMTSDDPLDLLSGTLAIAGAADTILILRRTGTAPGIDAQLSVRGRDMEDQDLAMRFWHERATWQIAGDWEEASTTGHKAAILAALKHGPLTLKELEAETEIEYRTLDKTVRRLVRSGELQKTTEHRYSLKGFVRSVRSESKSGGDVSEPVVRMSEVEQGVFGHSDTSDNGHTATTANYCPKPGCIQIVSAERPCPEHDFAVVAP
jgi:DNA-binding HxlR family transcriptional regulator